MGRRENQRRELEAVAKRSGWQIVGFYEDKGISGAKGREKRPGFDRLLKDATARRSLVGTDSATKSLDLPDTWHRPVHMATRIIETGASTAHQLVEIQVLSTMAASDAQEPWPSVHIPINWNAVPVDQNPKYRPPVRGAGKPPLTALTRPRPIFEAPRGQISDAVIASCVRKRTAEFSDSECGDSAPTPNGGNDTTGSAWYQITIKQKAPRNRR